MKQKSPSKMKKALGTITINLTPEEQARHLLTSAGYKEVFRDGELVFTKNKPKRMPGLQSAIKRLTASKN